MSLRARRLVLPSLLVAALVFAGCISIEVDGDGFGNGEHGSGILATENRSVASFTQVRVSGALRVEVATGPLAVEVTFDDDLINNLDTTVVGNEIRISCRDCSQSSASFVRVSAPTIDRIKISGASRVTATDIVGEELTLELSGASRIDIDGEVDSLRIDGSGASRIKARNLVTQHLDIDLSGATRTVVEVLELADGELSGASHLELTGSGSPIAVLDVSAGSSVEG